MSLPTLVADRVPADVVAAFVAGDVLGRCLKRKVRNRERDVSEERLVGVLLLVLLHEVDRVVGDRDGRIVAVAGLNGRQRLVVERVMLGRKVVVVIEQRIRAVEAAL